MIVLLGFISLRGSYRSFDVTCDSLSLLRRGASNHVNSLRSLTSESDRIVIEKSVMKYIKVYFWENLEVAMAKCLKAPDL